ncbi:MAG: Crp/Fnr family transcriptional regulator [Leptolyngbyaceae bacterium]|nr:Crp/Fnr family transcriptional regulator [Leptolyngbyaceae bacterium]
MLNQVQRLLFVRKVPLFEELRDDFLIRLASVMEELDFPQNHTIFRQGEKGESLYIVVSGSVAVHIGDRTIVELGSGSCFGEMAVIDAEPRSASVTTLERCECLLLTQQQLYEAIDEMPNIAVNVIRLLSRRIRTLNQSLNEVKEQHKAVESLDEAKDSELTPQPQLAASSASRYTEINGYTESNGYTDVSPVTVPWG